MPAGARPAFDPCTVVPKAAAQLAGQTTGPIAKCRLLGTDDWQWLADPTGATTYGRGFSLYITSQQSNRGIALIQVPARTHGPRAVSGLGESATFYSTDRYDVALQVLKDGWVVEADVYVYTGDASKVTIASLRPALVAVLSHL